MFDLLLTIKHLFDIIRIKQTNVQEGKHMRNFVNFVSDKKITIIVAIIVTVVLYVAISHPGESKADAKTASTKLFTCITVQEGDTLWTIAEDYMTEEYSSIQDYIDEVVRMNDIKDASDIKAGSNIAVPYYAVTDM